MIDLSIILFYFFAVIAIGFWAGRGEHSLADFALGQRQIPWWAVLTSIIAAETTAATFLGMPTEGYALDNYTLMQTAIGMILGRIIVGTFFIKAYFHYQVYSIYEFLEIRFGRKT